MTDKPQANHVVLVLLSESEEDKQVVGNTLWDKELHSKKKKDTTQVITSTFKGEAIHIVDSSCFKPAKNGKESDIKETVKYLQDKIRFVNAFVVIVNAMGGRNYNMVMTYVKAFSIKFLINVIVIVTQWQDPPSTTDTSPPVSTSPTPPSPTPPSPAPSLPASPSPSPSPKADFVQAWLDGLYQLLPDTTNTISLLIPFVFIPRSPEESKGNNEIILLARESPSFACLGLEPSAKILQKYQKKAAEKGLYKCKKCERYFVPKLQKTLAGIGKSEEASQITTALDEAAEIAHQTLTKLNMGAFDKLVTKAEGVVQEGKEVFRQAVASGAVEKAKEAMRKEVVKVGESVGARAGAFVGTMVLPGAGTSMGRFAGGSAGSRSAKFVLDACVDKLLGQNICHVCYKLKVAAKAAKKLKK